MTKNKSILVLGCSNTAGHELCDSLDPNYWDDILAMEDPHKEWWSSEATPLRVQKFFEEVHNMPQDWRYNTKHSWPYLLKDKFNVVSAALPATGISYVKTLYDLKHYKLGGLDPLLSKTAESIAWANIENKDDVLQLDHLSGKTAHTVDRFLSSATYMKVYKKIGAEANFRYDNAAKKISIKDFNESEETDWDWKGKDFQNLVDNVDILVWQMTNEPRICITHPSIDSFAWSPTVATLKTSLKHNLLNSAKLWASKHPNLSKQEVSEVIQAWTDEIEIIHSNLIKNLDVSQIMNDNIHFVNSILANRKMKGKKTILLYISEEHADNYDMDNRFLQECIDDKIVLKLNPSSNKEEIHKLIKEGQYPFQKFSHISQYTHKIISEKVEKLCQQ